MSRARFRFHGELNAFLAADRRHRPFELELASPASVRSALEAVGVPWGEVDAVRVDGSCAGLHHRLVGGETVEVHGDAAAACCRSLRPPLAAAPRFLADAHLGGLARWLRILGFDTRFEQALDDGTLRRIAQSEERVLLSRDRALLMCGDVAHGCFVHATRPPAQLAELAHRLDLVPRARPFTRCLRCNAPLEPVTAATVRARVPPAVAERHVSFVRCTGCDGVYWPGDHHRRMQARLRAWLPALALPGPLAVAACA